LSQAIAGHLTAALSLTARAESIEAIETIVRDRGDRMERKLDACFLNMLATSRGLRDDHVGIRRDLSEVKEKLGALTARLIGEDEVRDELPADDQRLQALCDEWVAILAEEYASDECLVELGQENGWFDSRVPSNIEVGGHHVVAAVLVDTARARCAEGGGGLGRLPRLQ
jgi:hypothetical protein